MTEGNALVPKIRYINWLFSENSILNYKSFEEQVPNYLKVFPLVTIQ